jgi:hypothetical protein
LSIPHPFVRNPLSAAFVEARAPAKTKSSTKEFDEGFDKVFDEGQTSIYIPLFKFFALFAFSAVKYPEWKSVII